MDWGDGGRTGVHDPDTGVYFRPEVGGKFVGSIEPACDGPIHEYPADPEDVYPGGAAGGLLVQWIQVYRAALRVPTLPIPDATSTRASWRATT